MSKTNRFNVKSPKKLKKINLEDHIDYWEEARSLRRHYFLNTIDTDLTQINNWLINNSKYYYDTADLSGLKDLYVEMCETLLHVRYVFNYEKIGKIIEFLISDGRFYIKPFAFPKSINDIHQSFVLLSLKWDEIVLKRFTFPYKTLLSIRYEIQSFLMYLSLEGCAQGIVAPKTNFSLPNIMKSCLDCLELPMSLYFDSFHLRKLLYQISQKVTPAFSLQCVHPVITQLQYIFQLYYKNIKSAWTSVQDLKHIPLTLLGFSYLIQNILVDNYNNMVFWKNEDYISHIEENILPKILQMLDLSMPLDVINKLLVQGFYDIIEVDCSNNFIRKQFEVIAEDINEWQNMIQTWNNGIAFPELQISKDENVFLQNFMGILYDRGTEDWDYAFLCMGLVHNFFTDRVRRPQYAMIIIRYFCLHIWKIDNTLHTQIQNWFQKAIDDDVDMGLSTSDSSESLVIEVEPDEPNNENTMNIDML